MTERLKIGIRVLEAVIGHKPPDAVDVALLRLWSPCAEGRTDNELAVAMIDHEVRNRRMARAMAAQG